VDGQMLNSLPKLRIEFGALAQKQFRHLVQHRFEAIVKGLVDVPKSCVNWVPFST
jgi:hypothetical protein